MAGSSMIKCKNYTTLVDSEYLLKWVHNESASNHNGPDTQASTSHVEHKQSNKDLLRWRFCKFPCFLY